jgi:hypothetical protein
LALNSAPALASKDPLEAPELDSKVKGLVFSELEVANFKNGETNHEGRIEYDTKRHQGFEAEFEIRARTKDNEVNVRKAMMNREFDDWRMGFGYDKKHFGREYTLGHRDRLTIARSPLYRRLEIFTYIGRESVFRFQREASHKKERTGYEFTLGQSEAQNLSVVAHQNLPFADGWSWGSWGLLQSRKAQEGRQFNWAIAEALTWRTDRDWFEWEFIGGVDPNESEIEELTGDGQPVYFWGMKTHYGWRYFLSEEEAWEPLVQSSFIVFDTERPAYNSAQLLIGANYYLLPIRVSLNLELIATSDETDTAHRTYDESAGRFEVSFEF